MFEFLSIFRLSQQLYHESTHFLLELVQNADDNSFGDCVVPTLSITYEGDFVRMDCNESGFTRENVEAICRIGKSTKGGADHATRYIGEKGIGFKSVFKLADSVWISSNGYSFKFERLKRLGMIAPIWDPLPHPHKPLEGQTTILMRIRNNEYDQELLSTFASFDPRLLIFLRQIRQIDLKVGNEPKRSLCRTDEGTTNGSHVIISLHHQDQIQRYLVLQHLTEGMPFEGNRPGCTKSEILLAFPMTADLDPVRDSQQVYAYLPIRDYDFNVYLLNTYTQPRLSNSY